MKVARVQTRLLVALMTVCTLVSARSIAPKNHRMGDIPPAQQQQQQQLELVLAESKPTTQTTSPAPGSSTPEIVINSIEEPIQANNVRHLYEQPPLQSSQATPEGHLEVVASELKMEARSQSDNSLEQTQQQEQLIVDHRPNESTDEQQFVNEYNASSGQSSIQPTPPTGMYQQTSSTPSSASSPTTTTTTATSSTTIGATTTSPNAIPSATSPPSGSMPNQWFVAGSSNQPQFYLASQNQMQQANGQANSQLGSMLSASSNQVVSLQHPTSINSIISEQQQPSGTNNNPAQVLATINGQPTSLIFLGQKPNAATSSLSANLNGPIGQQTQQQPVNIGLNGRRVSISNWLRGIGSLLANIFNRREHGLNQAGLMAASSNGYAFLTPVSTSVNSPPQSQSGGGSSNSNSNSNSNSGVSGGSGSGNWIQLGPNAPHWLTQAQSAVQQLGASSSRLAASLIQGPGQPLQLQGTTTNNFQQAPGDLQMSGSSQSLISVQTPAGVPLTNSGAQPYPGGAAIVLIPPMAQAHQQAQQQVTKQQQIQNAGQVQARSAQTRQTGGQQTGDSNAQTSVQVGFGRGQQPVTSTTPITSSSSSNQITRFNRSASSNPNSPSTGTARNGGNLPLAHYSHYSD